MTKRFELEDKIQAVWSTTEDINTVMRAILDGKEPLTEDEIANALIGISVLHSMKCEELFNLFETMVGERTII